MNFSRPYNSVQQNTAYATLVSVYLCPSDSAAVRLDPAQFIGLPQTSYAPVRGLRENIFWTQAGPNAANRCGANDSEGLFGANIAYRVADVIDGTSNTMMFGETSRFKEEESTQSFFSFWNVCAAWNGPPCVGGPAWPGDVRITGGAFVVPQLNAPPVTNGGPACQQNVAAPHSLNWNLPAEQPAVPPARPVGLPEPAPRRGQLRLLRRLGEVHQEQRQLPGLPLARHPRQQRDHQQRLLLSRPIGQAKEAGPARAGPHHSLSSRGSRHESPPLPIRRLEPGRPRDRLRGPAAESPALPGCRARRQRPRPRTRSGPFGAPTPRGWARASRP